VPPAEMYCSESEDDDWSEESSESDEFEHDGAGSCARLQFACLVNSSFEADSLKGFSGFPQLGPSNVLRLVLRGIMQRCGYL